MKNIQIALYAILALCVLMGPCDSEAQQPKKVYRIGYLSISPGDYERDPRNCPIVGSPKWQAQLWQRCQPKSAAKHNCRTK